LSSPPTKYLSQFDLLQIRTKLAAQLGESFDELNLNGLQSALAAPRQSMFGTELHPTLWDKAAVLLSRLINNHPFYDGNKRIAFIAVREFLHRNGWELLVDAEEAARFTRSIARGEREVTAIQQWLQEHSQQDVP